MWYVIDADEGAELVYGFKEKVSKEQFRKAVEDNTLMELVNRVPVKKGDVFFITPGTLHAIGKGILIAEIQQNSNVTYRVYDYGRLGADGKPRELHVEKALEVTNPEPPVHEYGQRSSLPFSGGSKTPLAECEYFRTAEFDITSTLTLSNTDSFSHILVLDGEADIISGGHTLHIKKGSSVFVPAGADTLNINGRCSIILTEI